MANPPKRKGTAAETALLRHLHATGHDAVRNPPSGCRDVGDLTLTLNDEPALGVVPCVVEVKNVRNVAVALRDGLRELEAEKANAMTEHGVLVIKPHGVGLDRVGEWYAVRRLQDDPELGA